MDALARQKISKRHFLEDIENSLYEGTHIGVEPQKIFFLFKISQQIQLIEMSKVFAKMAHGWQTDLVRAKILLSNWSTNKFVHGC